MKRKIVFLCLILLLIFSGFLIFFPRSTYYVNLTVENIGNNLAAVFFNKFVTISFLKDKYLAISQGGPRLNILVVPGHEPDFGGTEYRDLRERDMNVLLAKYLEEFLKKDDHYSVAVSRDSKSWNPKLLEYFNEHSNRIVDFINKHQDDMSRMVSDGSVVKIDNGIKHNSAQKDAALHLYAVNMWSNENKIDIVVHIHFNDYPRKNMKSVGEYSGFTIYIPEKQYSNSVTTLAIANTIYKRLNKYNAVSDLPKENIGIVEEQNLIAIGAYNTLDAPSMLIEYGYIYESQLNDRVTQDLILKDMAFQTYLGLQDFFGKQNVDRYDTLFLPHVWEETTTGTKIDRKDVLALQTALITEGLYPPQQKNKNDCPRTGYFGKCTTDALKEFQKKYDIEGEKNIVGDQTKKILNSLFSF
ncbi:MAG: N-acetylmuramoyl-L-alanine amidase [Candidatus Paceibacterota bacterium]